MRNTLGAAMMLAAGLAAAGPAFALETMVTQIEKNADGSMTYHFAVKTDPGETLATGDAKASADFVTV